MASLERQIRDAQPQVVIGKNKRRVISPEGRSTRSGLHGTMVGIQRDANELAHFQTARDAYAREHAIATDYAMKASYNNMRDQYAQLQAGGVDPRTGRSNPPLSGSSFGDASMGGGGAGGPDLSAFNTAETALKDQNVAAEGEIAKALADYLGRVGTNREQYTQQSGIVQGQMDKDQAASQAQNTALGAPIQADLQAQGVDPANVNAVVQGNAQTLNTSASLQDQYAQRNDQLMTGAYNDAQNAGALVNQSSQAERTNNYNALLAQLQQARADARQSYSQSAAGAQGYSGTTGGMRTVSRSGLDNATAWVAANYGTGDKTTYAWKQLIALGGGTANGILDAYNAKTPEQWASVGLPNMGDLVTGAIGELVKGDTESQEPITGGSRQVSIAGVGGSGQVNEGIADFVRELAAVPGFRISSGYRDPQRNADAGGVSNSNHLTGMAVDVVGDPEAIIAWARERGAREVINEGDHVHVAW